MRDRLTRLLGSRWFDSALALALVGAGGLGLALAHESQNALNDPYAPLVAAGFVAACFTVTVRRRYPVTAGCAVAGLVLIQGVAGDADRNLGAIVLVLCVLAYEIGAIADARRSAGAMALVLAMVEGGVVIDHGQWVPSLFVLGPWVGGRVVRSQQKIIVALEDRTQELEAEQDAYARLAVRHERLRIARELHDVVSHNLAVMVVQAGAGRVAPEGAHDRAAGRFANIRHAGEHGLDELSRLAAILSSDNGSDDDARRLPRVDALIEHARAAGLRIDESATSVDVQLPREIEQTAYRVVQEALTNAVKHAPGAALKVRLAVRDGMLEIDVSDDGGSRDASRIDTTGSGIGLVGMRGRVTALGGELHVGPKPSGGWRVSARLPAGPLDP